MAKEPREPNEKVFERNANYDPNSDPLVPRPSRKPDRRVKADPLPRDHDKDHPHKGGAIYAPPQFDDNDLEAPTNLEAAGAATEIFYTCAGMPYNQGNTDQCVSYAMQGYMKAGNIVNAHMGTFQSFFDLCKKNDEWAGVDYFGTSLTAGIKVARNNYGTVGTCAWPTGSGPAVSHMLNGKGPVILSCDWMQGMDNVDANGYIWPTGSRRTVHCFLVRGVNTIKNNPNGSVGAIRIMNSWGSWGQNGTGMAWLSINAFDRLIDGYISPGAVACPNEIQK